LVNRRLRRLRLRLEMPSSLPRVRASVICQSGRKPCWQRSRLEIDSSERFFAAGCEQIRTRAFSPKALCLAVGLANKELAILIWARRACHTAVAVWYQSDYPRPLDAADGKCVEGTFAAKQSRRSPSEILQ
jgi:hypothetical protein